MIGTGTYFAYLPSRGRIKWVHALELVHLVRTNDRKAGTFVGMGSKARKKDRVRSHRIGRNWYTGL
jgi:hypothetical protein